MVDTYKAGPGLDFIVTNSHGKKVRVNDCSQEDEASRRFVMLKESHMVRRMVKCKDLIKIEGGE